MAAVGATLGLAPYLEKVRRALRRLLASRGYSLEVQGRCFVFNLQDDIVVGVPVTMLDAAFMVVAEVIWAAGHDINGNKRLFWRRVY